MDIKAKDLKKKNSDTKGKSEKKSDSAKEKALKKSETPKSKEIQALPAEGCFVNRELSWLEFNLRVLQEAADHSVPLLERLKFLGIYQSNLDEFFRVRVGILTHRAKLMPDEVDALSGWRPSEQIRQVLMKTAEQQAFAETVWKVLRDELKVNGVDILDFRKISKIDELMSKKLFGDLREVLVPQIIRAGQPLPFLWDGESYILATLGRGTDTRYAVVPLHRLPRYMSFELEGRQKIIITVQLVRHFLPLLLKKEEIRDKAIVKVTRNADVFIEQNRGIIEDDDFRHKMENMLKKRKRELPVRLQINGKLQASTRAWLLKQLGITEESVFDTVVPFDLSFRSSIAQAPGFTYEPRKPAREIGLKKGEYFSYIQKHDMLLSLPFQSMMPVVDILYEAADDPDVLSIKITLYRLAASSKIAAALAYAADQGKDVLCLLELRARFDEQNNIDYSEMLEDAGCRVIYGLPEQKVHSKLCVITRQKEGNLSYITQVGTGNYNEVTGEQYTDLALFTSDPQAAADAEAAFQALIQGAFPPAGKKLWIAPLGYKPRLLELLDREKEKGPDGFVCIKVNSINNREVMKKLIECSKAGVKVELFVRGICCLRPGIPGETENITVRSVVGRWLEHSRIFQFGEGDDERLFIGSGDLLNRNTDRRVEAFIEAVTPETKEQLKQVLAAFRADKEKGRVMQSDGTYIREEGGAGTSSQEALYWYFSQRKVTWEGESQEEEPEPTEEIPVPVTEERAEPVEAETPVVEEPEVEEKAEPVIEEPAVAEAPDLEEPVIESSAVEAPAEAEAAVEAPAAEAPAETETAVEAPVETEVPKVEDPAAEEPEKTEEPEPAQEPAEPENPEEILESLDKSISEEMRAPAEVSEAIEEDLAPDEEPVREAVTEEQPETVETKPQEIQESQENTVTEQQENPEPAQESQEVPESEPAQESLEKPEPEPTKVTPEKSEEKPEQKTPEGKKETPASEPASKKKKKSFLSWLFGDRWTGA